MCSIEPSASESDPTSSALIVDGSASTDAQPLSERDAVEPGGVRMRPRVVRVDRGGELRPLPLDPLVVVALGGGREGKRRRRARRLRRGRTSSLPEPPRSSAARVSPSSSTSCRYAVCSGPTTSPPSCTGRPPSTSTCSTRPPTRARASSTITSAPPAARSRAAESPASPAPRTRTSLLAMRPDILTVR